MKFFCGQVRVLELIEAVMIDRIFNRIVIVRGRDGHKSRWEEPLGQQNPHAKIVFERQSDDLSRLVGRDLSTETDILRWLPHSRELKMDVRHSGLRELF